MSIIDTVRYILDDRIPVGDAHSEAALRAAAEALDASLRTQYDNIWDDNQAKVTHLIANVDDIGMYGDTATVCGAVTSHAGYGIAQYRLCPDCIAAAA